MIQLDAPKKVIFVCDGSKCGKYSKSLRKDLKELIKDADLKGKVEIIKMDCSDNCKQAPVLSFQPANQWYGEVSERKLVELFEEFIA